nr:DUF2807 domain-containing protein [Pedobacter panaciterrae]
MKTLTKTLIASALTAIVLTSSAFTTFAANPNSKLVSFKTGTITFNKVIISGNVKVILIKGQEEEVRIDEYYNPSKTTIARKGYNLLINSTEKYPVTITVTLKDLNRIQASGNASVATRGTLNLTCLQIFLNDNATASVKTNANSMYTILKGESTLKLSGTADSHTYVANNADNINFENFVCQKTDKLTSEPMASK